MSQTVIVASQQFAKQHLVKGIPEGGDRTGVILQHLGDTGILDQCIVADPKPCDLSLIELNHSKGYINDFREACASAKSVIEYSASDLEAWYLNNAFQKYIGRGSFAELSTDQRQAFRAEFQSVNRSDTPIVEDSFAAATLACGAAVEAARMVLNGDARNGFAIVRPPGHHAEFDAAMGFCFFNNIAIAARFLLEQGVSKLAIVDWDVHHGNGTQHSFYDDPRVLVCNLHQKPPYYPGFAGYADEIGAGRGEGFNLNIPLSPGSGPNEYKAAFSQLKDRLLEFKPEFILVSNGFDAHIADSISAMRLPTEFFGWMTDQLLESADKLCDGRFVSSLEGGYNRKVIPDCAHVHIESLVRYSTRAG